MAEVVIRDMHRFGLSDNIIGISFDTTSSNTGLIQWACTRIERKLGRILLWLACPHHTQALILKGVFEKCCSIPSSGPDIQIFRKFQNIWASLDKKSYTTMLDEKRPVQGLIETQRVKMINCLQNVIKDASHPREDYKELLQLSLLYLEELDPYADSADSYHADQEESSSSENYENIEIEVEGEDALAENKGQTNEILKRKRRDESKWKRNVIKTKRNRGEEYINYRGNHVAAKTFTPIICRKCSNSVLPKKQNTIHSQFYDLDWNGQTAWICTTVKLIAPKR
ncbi:unnamed protein product [Psylliodes chrysocephalus]|uniref:Uncharacterized protein n=1 Tax=Psylliodes chrysocephalus TaxID=3402493 RepID=A0A9P0GCX5_9CUCU|nr:unnamed protein product [Psylliodes chrysocephala]